MTEILDVSPLLLTCSRSQAPRELWTKRSIRMHPHGAADAQCKREVTSFMCVDPDGALLSAFYSLWVLQAKGFGGRRPLISKYNIFNVCSVEKHHLPD